MKRRPNSPILGVWILNREIIDILHETPLAKGNELWIVDGIRQYIRKGGLFFAKKVEGGEWLTTGDPVNYLRAILKYAFDRKDIMPGLQEVIREIMAAKL